MWSLPPFMEASGTAHWERELAHLFHSTYRNFFNNKNIYNAQIFYLYRRPHLHITSPLLLIYTTLVEK